MPRSVPLSVRISDADAAFLAKYTAEGATTPSEKLRAILREARQRQPLAEDHAGRTAWVANQLQPAQARWRNLQQSEHSRSDFVGKLFDRLPELIASLMAGPDGEDRPALERMESELAEQVFALIEEILDLGLTRSSRTHNPQLVQSHMEPILELAELIRLSKLKGSEINE